MATIIPERDSSPPQGLASHVAAPDPSVMKLTRGHSCVLCQQRKVRCDKNKPCANCVKAQVECRVVPPQPPRRRKKKPHERELIDRLKKYESLLAQHGVNFEPIGHDLKASDVAGGDDVDEIEHGIGGLKTSPSSSAPDFASSNQASSHYDKPSKWFPYYKEYKTHEDILRDSSDDDEDGGPTIHHAFDTMFDNQDGFPFVIGGSYDVVTEYHPSGIQILQLWQIYLDNVNPLLKLTHTPTLQSQIIEAGANPAKIPKPLEALMFSIYFIAIISMMEEDVQKTFGEEKSVLLSKYHHGCQQALINAGFMRSPDLITLQAYVIFLLCIRQFVDPRSLYCLIGIAVRVAQRLGLQRDGAQFGLPPFEVEQRRRLWWQLVSFDKRIAEITGSTITALSSSRGDCKWPLNVNDTDLYVHSKDPPTPYVGATEMIFCLTRIEMTAAANPEASGPVPHLLAAANKPKFQYNPSPASPDIVTHVANQNLPMADLDGYCNYIENAYLKHCDPKIPLHLFTLMMTRQALCKLRLIAYLCKVNLGDPRAMDPTVRDHLFMEAIRMIEYDNVIQSTESLRGFLWYTFFHFPFPAYIFLVSELRTLTSGELCDRAWAAIAENHDKRALARNLRSPMHIALGRLFLKAWDAHTAAEIQQGRPAPPTPKLITVLQQLAAKQHNKKQSTSGNAVVNESVPVPATGYGGSRPPMDSSPAAPSINSMGTPDTMFSGFDPMSQMFNSGMPDIEFGQMDWSTIMQGFTGFGGIGVDFGGFPQGGMPAPQGGMPGQQHGPGG